MKREFINIKLAELTYSENSAKAFDLAESEAFKTGNFPVRYPSPYDQIGCGYGALASYLKKALDELASTLGIDIEICHQTDLLVILHLQTELQFIEYKRKLSEILQPVNKWIINSGDF